MAAPLRGGKRPSSSSSPHRPPPEPRFRREQRPASDGDGRGMKTVKQGIRRRLRSRAQKGQPANERTEQLVGPPFQDIPQHFPLLARTTSVSSVVVVDRAGNTDDDGDSRKREEIVRLTPYSSCHVLFCLFPLLSFSSFPSALAGWTRKRGRGRGQKLQGPPATNFSIALCHSLLLRCGKTRHLAPNSLVFFLTFLFSFLLPLLRTPHLLTAVNFLPLTHFAGWSKTLRYSSFLPPLLLSRAFISRVLFYTGPASYILLLTRTVL